MKKIYWLRRIALLFSTFVVGVCVTGSTPVWLKFGLPILAIWWLMIYDEAMFEIEKKKRARQHETGRKTPSVPMQRL